MTSNRSTTARCDSSAFALTTCWSWNVSAGYRLKGLDLILERRSKARPPISSTPRGSSFGDDWMNQFCGRHRQEYRG